MIPPAVTIVVADVERGDQLALGAQPLLLGPEQQEVHEDEEDGEEQICHDALMAPSGRGGPRRP